MYAGIRQRLTVALRTVSGVSGTGALEISRWRSPLASTVTEVLTPCDVAAGAFSSVAAIASTGGAASVCAGIVVWSGAVAGALSEAGLEAGSPTATPPAKHAAAQAAIAERSRAMAVTLHLMTAPVC